jgi:uncharacterized protein (TIGR01370 family)
MGRYIRERGSMRVNIRFCLRTLAIAAGLLITDFAEAQRPGTWVCYYSDLAPLAAFNNFDLLVLDSDSHPALGPLSDRGKRLFGYISVGEVENHRSYFNEVQAEGILLQENVNWKGSFFVDVRDLRWTKRIVEKLIPEMLRRGFHGIFLDTVDNAPHLERVDARRYRGMTAGMVSLIRAIRQHFPRVPVIMNRGFEILPEVESHIDMVLGESVFADYDFETKKYRLTPSIQYRSQVALLKEAQRRRPELTVLTLDYWDPADTAGLAHIYREQRANGFIPYVATLELDEIVPEPK